MIDARFVRAFEEACILAHGVTVLRPGSVVHQLAHALAPALLAAAAPVRLAAPVVAELAELAERVSVTLPTPHKPVIILSRAAVSDALVELCTLFHERQHVQQIQDVGGVQAGVDYLGSGELRAQREADADACARWARWACTGHVSRIEPLADLYHLRPEEQALAADVRASHAASMAAGRLPPLASLRAAATWMSTALETPDDVRRRVDAALAQGAGA